MFLAKKMSFAVVLLGLFGLLTDAALGQTDAQNNPGTTTSEKTVTERVTTIHETNTQVAQQQTAGPIVAAIFVKNRAEGVPDAKVAVLEDMVTAHLTDQGFRIISREDVLNAVASFADAGPNKGDASLPGADLDKILSNNTSAARLAQNLSASYILVAAIDTYGTDQVQYDEGNIHTLISESKMTLTYKLLDVSSGGSLSSGEVTSSRKDRVQPGLVIKRDMVNTLLTDAAEKLAKLLGDKAAAGRVPVAAAVPNGAAQFVVVCTMADLTVPITTRNDAGDYVVTTNATIQIPATVQVDGIAVGTSPGPLQASPGIHKVRISAAGFRDWSYTSNVFQGERLDVALQLDNEGYARWGQSAAFLQNLKDKAKLTNAEADKIEGLAQMFRQSGFKIDIKSDTKRNINISGAPAPTIVPVIPVLPVVPLAPVAPVAPAAPAPTTQPQH